MSKQSPEQSSDEPNNLNRGDSLAEGFGSLTDADLLGERGMHLTTRLENPQKVGGFGTFNERLDYTEGCNVVKELEGKTGVVIWQGHLPDGTAYQVGLAKTQSDWDPRQGGRAIEGAGDPGDYLLLHQTAGPDATASFRYLDSADIDGMMVTNRGNAEFKPNEARQRQISMPGQIEAIVGYR